MEAAQAGDIILVYEGTYDRYNNGEDFPIAFKEGVVLKWAEYGKMPVIDASGKPRSFDCYNISAGSNTKIEGMKIYGGEAIYSINYPQSFGGGMLLDNAEISHFTLCI